MTYNINQWDGGKNREARRTKKRAVVYIRYSSHKQNNSYSVEYQMEECLKYIERKGYIFVKRYVDEATTGKKVAGRAAFDQMVHDAERGDFDTIIVFSFSRSFRNTRDALNYNHELREKCGVTFESVIEQLDLSDPHGKFSGTTFFAVHELQSDITAAHVRSGMYIAAKQGYYLGGFVPYGYTTYGTGEFSRGKEKQKYTPDPEEAENVRDMFRMYADGFSLNYIQRHFRDKGIKSRRGDTIGLQTLARILKNDFYIGTRRYSVTGYEPINIENCVPAIVPPEIWADVQKKHKKNAENATPRKKGKRLYALTGKIFCEKCGAHMFGTYKGDRRKGFPSYSYYHCASKKTKGTCDAKNVRKDLVEKYCIDQIKKHILNTESIKMIAEYIVSFVDGSPNDLKAQYDRLQARKKELMGYVKELLLEKMKGNISPELLQEMSSDYNSEIAEIDLDLLHLQNAIQNAVTVEAVEAYLNAMMENVDEADEHIMKSIFDKLIEKIIVNDDTVTVYLSVSPLTPNGDNGSSGQPRYTLSLNIRRSEL